MRSIGIAQAQSKNATELEEELLRPLREARNVLMSYKSFALVPVICSAAFVESDGMIMANYRKTRIEQALNSYEGWLKNIARGTSENTLDGAIASASAKYKQKMTELQRGWPDYECMVRYTITRGACPAGGIWIDMVVDEAVGGAQLGSHAPIAIRRPFGADLLDALDEPRLRDRLACWLVVDRARTISRHPSLGSRQARLRPSLPVP